MRLQCTAVLFVCMYSLCTPSRAGAEASGHRPNTSRVGKAPVGVARKFRGRGVAREQRAISGEVGGAQLDYSKAVFDPSSGKRCIIKEESINTLDKSPIMECIHKESQQCHYTYITNFTPSQEEVCEETFEKQCQVTFTQQAVDETVRKCYRPVVKVCNGAGDIVCKTIYESSCTTKYVERQPGKFVGDTSCEKLPIEVCGAGCSTQEGAEECHDKVISSLVQVPEEQCDLNPQKTCRLQTKLVPKLVPQQECTRVPREVCTIKHSTPKMISKPLITKWCLDDSSPIPAEIEVSRNRSPARPFQAGIQRLASLEGLGQAEQHQSGSQEELGDAEQERIHDLEELSDLEEHRFGSVVGPNEVGRGPKTLGIPLQDFDLLSLQELDDPDNSIHIIQPLNILLDLPTRVDTQDRVVNNASPPPPVSPGTTPPSFVSGTPSPPSISATPPAIKNSKGSFLEVPTSAILPATDGLQQTNVNRASAVNATLKDIGFLDIFKVKQKSRLHQEQVPGTQAVEFTQPFAQQNTISPQGSNLTFRDIGVVANTNTISDGRAVVENNIISEDEEHLSELEGPLQDLLLALNQVSRMQDSRAQSQFPDFVEARQSLKNFLELEDPDRFLAKAFRTASAQVGTKGQDKGVNAPEGGVASVEGRIQENRASTEGSRNNINEIRLLNVEAPSRFEDTNPRVKLTSTLDTSHVAEDLVNPTSNVETPIIIMGMREPIRKIENFEIVHPLSLEAPEQVGFTQSSIQASKSTAVSPDSELGTTEILYSDEEEFQTARALSLFSNTEDDEEFLTNFKTQEFVDFINQNHFDY